ncbi:thioredoxin domain-containing protein [Deinococcus cellulosilyticus]|uniref:Thioredoxin-like fold domain-containing protein n=1 Tax=Deinococcus cellulosilyticus (strain DSM 18568 / NBRC 106333 / KACC 11606 / 5516J-15) TaxID=1223518 RepID=A0A511N653_DEIC1|nr:thioredoxin domain-containing protein [Deinococcus cellulosilyticus]GEM47916.1 hypothetical protein DC3_35510 [Deinococcus cellulosilyticus NBRC 106333 = KACC 11606]
MSKKSQNFERLEREQRQAQMRIITTIGIVILAVIVLAVVQSIRSSAPKQLDLVGQPTLGSADARVSVIVFEDFKCPVCKMFDSNIFPVIEEKYVNTGKVQVGFRNFMVIAPNGDSKTAAVAGECVYNQNKDLFFPFAHLMYRAQGDENTVWATKERILEVAGYVPGINRDDLGKCIDENRYEKEVMNDQSVGSSAGVNGTPSVFVNGVKVSNPLDEATMMKAIDDALAKAQ